MLAVSKRQHPLPKQEEIMNDFRSANGGLSHPILSSTVFFFPYIANRLISQECVHCRGVKFSEIIANSRI